MQFVPYTVVAKASSSVKATPRVFSNGQMIKGHWAKTDPTLPTAFSDATGAPIAHTAGRTMVEFFPVGQNVDATRAPGVTPHKLAPDRGNDDNSTLNEAGRKRRSRTRMTAR